MASSNRSALSAKVHKVLKKHYEPVAPDANRPVLEHLLFACCLQDAHYEVAEEAFAALVHTFFDWNEIRVSTVRELAEVMAGLPDPPAAANRLKRVLQDVFESSYTFDLEDLRKMNLGPAVDRLRKIEGITNFCVAYVVQSALGGHAIPVDSGVIGAFRVLGLITDRDASDGVVPGLDRAISKSRGIEFGALLHRLGADFTANPYAPALHEILLQIDPTATDRLPKRRSRKRRESAPAEKAEEAPPEKADQEVVTTPRAKAKVADTGPKKKAARRKKKDVSQDTETERKEKAPAEEKEAATQQEGAEKKPAAAKKDSPSAKSRAETDGGGKKSASAGLSKRKPR